MSMRRSTLAAVFVSVLVWWWPASALAQSRATCADLTGTVKDDSQAVVPGARVTALNLETNLEREAVTRSDGRFLLAAVPLGVYRVQIDLTGFATIVLERVELALGNSVDVDVVLHPAAIAEAISVAAESPIVDTRRTVIASVVSRIRLHSCRSTDGTSCPSR